MTNYTPNDEQATQAVVKALFDALDRQDMALLNKLLADDVVYINTSLPTLKGRKMVVGILSLLLGKHTGFQATFKNITANDDIVMTERREILRIGALHIPIWACGSFEIKNGKIMLWEDYFDWLNVSRGVIHGLIGMFIPGLRAKLSPILVRK